MCARALSNPRRAASPKKNQKPSPPPSSVSVTAITPAATEPVSRRAQRTSPARASIVIAQLGQIRAAGMLQPPAISSALAKSGANG